MVVTHDAPDGPTNLVLGTITMGMTWLVAVNQPKVQAPLGQGEYCYGCIEQEQTSPDKKPVN